MKTTQALLVFCFLLSSCDSKKEEATETPETLVTDYMEDEMDAAIAKAKSSIEEFLSAMEAGSADSFSVKAPISDENGTEHFWLTDVTYTDGEFSGAIGNDPGIIKKVKFGQPWQVKKNEISDWMYTRGQMIHGGFTIDPLLDSYPEDEAETLRSKLVR